MAMNDDNTPPAPFPLWTTVIVLVIGIGSIIFFNFNSALNLWASQINSQTLEFYKAVGTLLVALIAACVAGGIQYRQWKTAQQKINIEMFDKRFAVFSAVYDIQDRLIWKGDTNEAKVDYYKAVRQSEFLFDEEVYNYLVGSYLNDVLAMSDGIFQMRGNAMQLTMYHIRMKKFGKWSNEEHKVIKSMFNKYLKLDSV
jgi:hypothetical protein